jgi:hypothetical protein
MKKILLIILLSFIPLPSAVADIIYDGLSISNVEDIKNTGRGYSAIRVNVNNSKNINRKVKLSISDYNNNWEISKTFTVEPNETKEEMMCFPVFSIRGGGIKVTVDGKLLDHKHGKLHDRVRGGYYSRQKYIFLDSAIPPQYMERLDREAGINTREHDYITYGGSDEQLYKIWTAYERFAAIVFYVDTFSKLPWEIKDAIFDYSRMGGNLVLIGEDMQLPSDFILADQDRQTLFKNYESGIGNIYFLGEQLVTFKVKTDSRGNNSQALTGSLIKSIDPKAYEKIVGQTYLFNYKGADLTFNQEELLALTPYQFATLVVLFVFLLGPMNIWWLQKKKRLNLIFVTVPLISLVLCFTLGLYYYIFESRVLNVKKQALIILNEAENKAYTVLNYGVFSAKSRPDGLWFSESSVVFPDVNERRGYVSQSELGSIQLDDGQRFASGWIRARTPRTFYVQSIEHCREKVLFTNEKYGYKVVNGLGAEIKELIYLSHDRQLYVAKNIGIGSAVQLEKSDADTRYMGLTGLGKHFRGFGRTWFERVEKNPNRFVRPGQYRATLDNSSLVTQSFESKARVEGKVYLYGNANGGANL